MILTFFRQCNYKCTKDNSVRDGDTSPSTSNSIPTKLKLHPCALYSCFFHVYCTQIWRQFLWCVYSAKKTFFFAKKSTFFFLIYLFFGKNILWSLDINVKSLIYFLLGLYVSKIWLICYISSHSHDIDPYPYLVTIFILTCILLNTMDTWHTCPWYIGIRGGGWMIFRLFMYILLFVNWISLYFYFILLLCSLLYYFYYYCILIR